MKLKVGVIGLGIGEEHLKAYSAHPECEVVGISDLSSERLEQIGKQFQSIKLASKDADALLKSKSIDVISIASYDNFHYEQVIKALENGKHVFVEKPICLFEHEARHIRELSTKHPDLKISSNLVLRKSPRLIWLKRAIDQGDLGDLFFLEGDYNFGRLSKITQGWRGKLDFYSPIYGGGVHMIDLLLWFTSDLVEEVYAAGNNIVTKDTPIKFYDMVVSLLKFRGGALAKMAVNFGCVYPHFHKLSVYGTKATFENGLEHGLLFESRDVNTSYKSEGMQQNPKPKLIEEPHPSLSKGELISAFIDSILKNSKPLVSKDEILNGMSVCFAIEKASKENRAVRVEYL